jgi:hypothetical protein
MVKGVFKALVGTLSICVIFSGAFSRAECLLDMIMVKGQVEHAPRQATVRIQLIYPKDKIGESGDVSVDDRSFRIRVPFFTQSRAPFLNGIIPPEKCARKPNTVVVSLMDNGQEYDRVSLDMAKDFKKINSSDYALRSEVLLQGPSATAPIQ